MSRPNKDEILLARRKECYSIALEDSGVDLADVYVFLESSNSCLEAAYDCLVQGAHVAARDI